MSISAPSCPGPAHPSTVEPQPGLRSRRSAGAYSRPLGRPGRARRRHRVLRLDHEAENAVRQRLGAAEADAFLARLEHLSFDTAGPLEQVYGGVIDTTRFATALILDALDAAAGRPALLRLQDRRREIDPAWFQRSRMIGYVCYADRFAGSLRGVRQHLDYLAELGVTYLHLMPLLRPRDGDSDGGCAVAGYGAVDPRG